MRNFDKLVSGLSGDCQVFEVPASLASQGMKHHADNTVKVIADFIKQ